MAEVTGFRNNALPYPIYGQQFTIVYPMLDADGDLVTGASTPDAERSLNGDTFGDCTNESTEIATSSGVYYLTLTATEMTADIVTVIAKSATAGMKTTVSTLYPRKLVTIRTGTCNDDGSGTADVVLDANASAVDDYYNGMVIAVIIDGAASAECRVITDYNGSTKAATVAVGFNTAVDNTDTFIIYLPEGAQHPGLYAEKVYSDTTHIDSDIASHFTVLNNIVSDIQSDTNVLLTKVGEADWSDILSACTIIKSQTTVIKSDVISHATIISDIQSDTNVVITKLGEADTSDILSLLTLVRSDTAVIEAITSDIQSDTNVLITKMRGVVLATGTIGATGNTTTVVHVPDGVLDSLSDDEINNYNIVLYDNSNDEYHVRTIVDWTNTGDLATVAPAFPFTPEASVDLYWIMPPWANQFDYDHSDIMSLLTLVRSDTTVIEAVTSDIQSDTNVMVPIVSDIQSDTNVIITKLTEADTSDILSRLTVSNSLISKVYSDTTTIQSDTTSLASDLAEGDFSDILSRLTVTNSQLLVVKSDTSDIRSALVIIASDAAAIDSNVDKVYSDTTKIDTQTLDIQSESEVIQSQVLVIKSDTSDIQSHLTVWDGAGGILSDINSGVNAIQAAGAALTSDQDSKLTAITTTVLTGGTLFELVSDIYSDTTAIEAQGSSSLSSDQDSKLTRVAAAIVEVDTSDLMSMLTLIRSDTTHIESDAANIEAVTSDIQSDTNVMVPIISDIQSDTNKLVSDASEVDTSDIRSALTALTTAGGLLSDMASKITRIHSDTITLASDLAEGDFSDILSRLTVTNSQLLVVKSDTSDIRSALVIIASDTLHIESDCAADQLILSDVQSDTNKLVSDATEVDASDILSLLTLVRSDTAHIESDAASIESKTNSLTFTVAGQVDANIESVNATNVNGSGTGGDPWGP